ncbi:MAG TPA: hypothetical protein VFC35_06675, partial [Gemmatimonadaceae bacterium]|nr:hypothetical protein [Gemmatimonadaceae bacterium]
DLVEHHGTGDAHRATNSNPKNVPFRALDQASIHGPGGELLTTAARPPCAGAMSRPHLDVTRPLPPGVRVDVATNIVTFSTSSYRIGFSTLRPIVTFLAWDSEGTGRLETNLLYDLNELPNSPTNGPWLSQTLGDTSAGLLAADIQVEGNTVTYGGLKPADGLTSRMVFTMERLSFRIDFEQSCTTRMRALEWEALRLLWDTRRAITATLSPPIPWGKTGRGGIPAVIHAPNHGSLAVELTASSEAGVARLRVDSWRDQSYSQTGIEIGCEEGDDGELYIQEGVATARLEFTPTQVGLLGHDERAGHPSWTRAWTNVFGFRPELGGMSNNASSLNCHFVQHVYADMALNTTCQIAGFNVMDLVGWSAQLGLRGGSGYGDSRELYLDSDASLLIAAGVYSFAQRDLDWARSNLVHIRAAAERLMSRRDDSGMVVCAALSGNSGERNWSSNWWDVISFGHLDAFANAFIFRALLQTASMCRLLSERELADRYDSAANAIHDNYFATFYNRDTDRLAGWRSKDGVLHDYGFLFVNGIAAAYGLIPAEHRAQIIEGLRAQLADIGYNYFHLGLPGNLEPIRREDYADQVLGAPQREDGTDSFGVYQNGGATMSQSYFFLRALHESAPETAREIGAIILDAFEHGRVVGGLHEGNDWRYWDGRRGGYEGLLSDQMYVLLAIAQNEGLAATPPDSW